jgi:hypothetical protein
VAQRLADLIRRARRLASERDRAIDSLAEEWVRALRDQALSRADLDELWGALTEEALRRLGRSLDDKWNAQLVRQETEEVMARLRTRVEAALGGDARTP